MAFFEDKGEPTASWWHAVMLLLLLLRSEDAQRNKDEEEGENKTESQDATAMSPLKQLTG